MNYILDPINLIPIALFLFMLAVLYPRLTLTAIIVILASHIVGTPVIPLPPSYDWMAYGFLIVCASPILSVVVFEDFKYRPEKIFGVEKFRFVNPEENNYILLKQGYKI